MDENTKLWLTNLECEVSYNVALASLRLRILQITQDYAHNFEVHGYVDKHFIAAMEAKVYIAVLYPLSTVSTCTV